MPSNQDFNGICYLARYNDLSNNPGWMWQSAVDGSWKYGKTTNRKLKKISDDPFWHWQNFGMKEGRVCGCDLPGTIYSAEFNASAYLSRYYDVRVDAQFKNNPLGHYQQYGIYEGRHPGFEILTSKSMTGMVSPGTTTMLIDTAGNNTTPGDGTIITNPNDIPPTTDAPPAGFDIQTFVTQNPLIVAAAGGLVLILLHKKRKR